MVLLFEYGINVLHFERNNFNFDINVIDIVIRRSGVEMGGIDPNLFQAVDITRLNCNVSSLCRNGRSPFRALTLRQFQNLQ